VAKLETLLLLSFGIILDFLGAGSTL
jgi:hypothetical protein